MKRALLALVLSGLGWLAAPASAHEVRPALLSISEDASHRYELRWKQPNMGEVAVRLVPHLSNGWLEEPPAEESLTPRFLLRVWRKDAAADALEGQTISVEGLDRTITDTLVDVRLADGRGTQAILKPGQPSLQIHLRRDGLPVLSYLRMGVEHILTGADHLMFVFGLLLLVKGWVRLVKTVTAFTVAHSMTLAASALGLIRVQPPLIEALVALSIVFLAVELVHNYQGRDGLTAHFPWLIAFSFGLLHGFAFGGALADVGLPPHAIPLALLLFNLGVEAGQLLFVGAAILTITALRHLPRALPPWTRWVPPYAIGSFASFWLIQRTLVAFAQ